MFEPGEYERYRHLMHTKLDLPDDWFEPPVISAGFRELGLSATGLWQKNRIEQFDYSLLEKLHTTSVLSDQDWFKMRRDMEELQDFIQSLHDVIRYPEYEMTAFQHISKSVLQKRSWVAMQIDAKVLMMQAYSYAERGDWPSAFETNAMIYRLSDHHPCTTLIGYLIAAMVRNMASEQLLHISDWCTDEVALKDALEGLNQWHSQSVYEIPLHPLLLDWIATMRWTRLEDDSLKMLPNQNGRYYYRLLIDQMVQKRDLSRNSVPLHEEFLKHYNFFRRIGFRRHADAYIYRTIMPNFFNLNWRMKLSAAKVQLARIALASRLYELKEGEKPQQVSQLMPYYLPELPIDPLVSDEQRADFRFEPELKVFYSIGPDQIDNHLKWVYDPSNGIRSRGDVLN